MHLICKRVSAWLIDWSIIVIYACVLLGIAFLLSRIRIIDLQVIHPITGQLVGFFSLTLPVVVYCISMEAGSRHGTVGKRILKINVAGTPLTKRAIVLRNIIKFLPWECAHAGVQWVRFLNTTDTPVWIWVLLILPQVLMLFYFITIVATKGSRSVYDWIAGTYIRYSA